MVLTFRNHQFAHVAACVDLKVWQLVVHPDSADGAPLRPRKILHPGNAKNVPAPLVAAEQGCRPYIKFDIAGNDKAEFVLVIRDDGRKPGMHPAFKAPHLESVLECLQDLAERDVVWRPTPDIASQAIDTVGLMLKYLPVQM